MRKTLSIHFTFSGNAAEVFEHWARVFDGDLTIMRYEEIFSTDFPVPPDPDAVAHAHLKLAGGTITGNDDFPGNPELPLRGTAYSMLYSLTIPEEARQVIRDLVAGGGEVIMPFEEDPRGGCYGQVMDRFGVLWALDVEAPEVQVEDTSI